MSSPLIWNGSDAKLLVSGDLKTKDGAHYPKAHEKTYVAEGHSTATGWDTVDGTGGTTDATVMVTTETTAANLPRPNTTKTGVKFSSTAASGGIPSAAHAYKRLTLDPADYGKKLKVQFDQVCTDTNWTIWVFSNTAADYSGTSTRLALSTDSDAVTTLPALTGSYQTTFDAPGSSAPYLEFRVQPDVNATSDLVISDLIIGPGTVVQGAAVGSPTLMTGWTLTNAAASYSMSVYGTRLGSLLYVQGSVKLAGANTNTLQLVLPTGYTVDPSALRLGDNGGSAYRKVGSATFDDTSASTYYGPYDVLLNSTSTTTMFFQRTSLATSANESIGATTPVTAAAGDSVYFDLWLPISEWANSGTVDLVANEGGEFAYNTDTSDANDTTSFGYGPAGVAIGSYTSGKSKRVRFQTPIQETDRLVIEVQKDASTAWVDVSNAVYLNGLGPLTFQNGTTYGMGFNLSPIANATDIDVVFGDYAYPSGTTYGAAGAAWSGFSTYNWRVRKTSAPQAVGVAEVRPGISSGLVSANGLRGRTDGSSVASGYVGEEKKQTKVRSAKVSLSNGVSANVTSSPLSLDAGVWELTGTIGFNASSPTSVLGYDASISIISATTPGADTISVADSDGQIRNNANVGLVNTSSDFQLFLGPIRVNITSDTDYYLVGQAAFSGGTVGAYGTIRAVRIA